MMLNFTPEIKEKWVAALRSGEYKQGKIAKLKYGNGYCCLGVLADVVDPDGWRTEGGVEAIDALNDAAYNILPHKTNRTLYIMNDGVAGRRWSFNEIADWIEENL